MFNDDIYPPPTTKDYVSHSQPLYVRQPYSLQIIQLVECSPPPPTQQQQKKKYPSPSRLSSSSSSPYSESDSDSDSDGGSAYDSSSSSLSAGSGCESYCSSAEEEGNNNNNNNNAQPVLPPSFENRDPSIDDTYHTRQRRVSLWRDAVYSKDAGVPTSPISPTCTSSSGSCFPSRPPPSCSLYLRNLNSSHPQQQLVPLLRPKSEKLPMVIWPTAIRW